MKNETVNYESKKINLHLIWKYLNIKLNEFSHCVSTVNAFFWEFFKIKMKYSLFFILTIF